jgi:peroxiredoxin
MKLFIIGLFMALPLFLTAQMSMITGTVTGERIPEEIHFFTIHDGAAVHYASTRLNGEGTFGFLIPLAEEGFYAIGQQGVGSVVFPLYLKPGDHVNVEIEGTNIRFPGEQTPENKVLGGWLTLGEDIRLKSMFFARTMSDYEDFFPDFGVFVEKAESFRTGINTPNTRFNHLMKEVVGFDMDLYAINFLYTPRTKHPERSDWPAYYHGIVKDKRFPDDTVLETLFGARLLGFYPRFAAGTGVNDTELLLSHLGTNRQKVVYLQSMLSRINSFAEFQIFREQYGKYYTAPDHRHMLEARSQELYDASEGQTAADFTYPGLDGDMISLSDFKGKVVLVDVWATWCAPCLQQLPHLKELKTDFKGTDLVVLAVSVDVPKDEQKWRDMIVEKEIEAVHVFAGGWTEITKYYNITGIPRFMLFDREGKIVSANAPRPSDPNLRTLIERALQK